LDIESGSQKVEEAPLPPPYNPDSDDVTDPETTSARRPHWREIFAAYLPQGQLIAQFAAATYIGQPFATFVKPLVPVATKTMLAKYAGMPITAEMTVHDYKEIEMLDCSRLRYAMWDASESGNLAIVRYLVETGKIGRTGGLISSFGAAGRGGNLHILKYLVTAAQWDPPVHTHVGCILRARDGAFFAGHSTRRAWARACAVMAWADHEVAGSNPATTAAGGDSRSRCGYFRVQKVKLNRARIKIPQKRCSRSSSSTPKPPASTRRKRTSSKSP